MSAWVMVTAYFASSCWISTRSSVLVGCVILENLSALHDEVDVTGNGDVGQRISRHRDDIGQIASVIRPRSGLLTRSAATTVAARSTASAGIPQSTRVTNSSAFFPWGMAGASVPTAIFTPASYADLIEVRALGNISAALSCNSFGARETSI